MRDKKHINLDKENLTASQQSKQRNIYDGIRISKFGADILIITLSVALVTLFVFALYRA